MQEIWKDIEGYEGIYQISNIGNIKNSKKNKIRKTYNTNQRTIQSKLLYSRKEGINGFI